MTFIPKNLLPHKATFQVATETRNDVGEVIYNWTDLYIDIDCRLEMEEGELEPDKEGYFAIVKYIVYLNPIWNNGKIAINIHNHRISKITDSQGNEIFDGTDFKIYWVELPAGTEKFFKIHLRKIHQG